MPVTVRDIDGKAYDVRPEEADSYRARGFTVEGDEQRIERIGADVREDLYGGVGGALKAGAAGALRTATLSLSDAVGEALGVGHSLRALRDENPIATLGGELLGAFAPVGPAAGLTGLGRKIVSTGEGAGAVAKAGITAGAAAVEGAGFGGGMYLSQVALDDKPLAAEGFIGAMGHGALFAAPIGGVFSLGESTLLRARQLFPQQQVTREAARGVKQEATTALTQSVADGDQMAQAIQRKIELSEAKIGMAESGERVTRRMFGEADPVALSDQAVGAFDKTQLADALQKYQISRAQLDDWIRHEADPDLEAALLGLTAPEVGQVGGRIEKRVGKFGEPELAQGTPVSPEFRELNAALDMRARQIDVTKVGKRPANDVVPEELIAGVGKPSPVDEAPHQGRDVRIATVRPVEGASSDMPKMRISEFGDEGEEILEGLATADPRFGRVTGDEYAELKNDYKAKLSSKEKEAVLEYSGESAYSMNRQVRRGFAPESDRRLFDDLDAALDKGRLSRPVQVYRGLEGKEAVRIWNDLKPGDRFTDRAWGSASSDIGMARRGEVTLAIDVPGGYPAAAIPTRNSLENELLLRRDTTYEIVSIGKLDDGHTIAHVRVIPTDSPRLIRFLSGDELKAATPIGGTVEIHRAPATVNGDDLLSALRATGSQLDSGAQLGQLSKESPAAADYTSKKLAKRADDAAYFRAKHAKSSGLEGIVDAQRMVAGEGAADDFFSALTKPKTRDQYVAQNIGRAMREEGSHAAGLARLEREWAAQGAPQIGKAIVEHAGADETTIGRALGKRTGKNVDMSPDLSRAAKVIGDIEESIADMADVLGAEAPITAAEHAKLFRAARAAQADAAAAGAAQAGQDLATKVQPMLNIGDTRTLFGGKTVVDDEITKALRAHDAKASTKLPPVDKAATAVPPSAVPAAPGSVLGKLADVGTALEVLQAMGVHTPDISKIPVIGPILSLYLKARAVLSILGRKGGSIPRSTEGLVASKSAETRNRINAATTALLEGGAKASKKIASYAAGPAVLLGTQLFPGDGETKSKDARKLYEARIDELTRAQQPGAVAAAIGDRIQTSDPVLREAVIAQAERGLKFLYGKAPKQTLAPGMVPGDGDWHLSKTSLEEFGRFVHAVNDPASVLEDLAKGHISIEGAEALRVVYPALFAEAQKLLLEAAPKMNKTMPYSKRVAISIMYQIPIDGSMTPQHMQFLQPPPMAGAAPMPGAPPGPPPGAPALTGPLQTGQQMAPPLDRRAGA